MAFSGGGPSGAQINVTPLIDVLLTLIVMFMLVVAMDPEYGEKVQIPQPNAKSQPTPERTIVIQVVQAAKDQPPTFKINRDEVPLEVLETTLARIYLTRAEKVAFVGADPDVDFRYIAEVIDLAHHAGVDRIGLMTERLELAAK